MKQTDGSIRTRNLAVPGTASVFTVAVIFLFVAGCSRGTPESREAEHLTKGKDFLQKKDFRRAAIEFKVASQNMPKDAEPVYQLGMTYMQAGAVRLALESFQKAGEINSKHEGVRHELALFKVGSSKPEIVQEAKQEISAYLTSHPEDGESMSALAMVEAKLGNRAEAQKWLEAAVLKDPTNMRPASVLIAYYAAKGDTDTAKDISRALAAKLPNSPEAAVLRAEVSLVSGDFSDADAQISRALSLKRDFRPALQLRLRREIISGNQQSAEQTTKELAKQPERQTWSAYARMLFGEKRVDEGIAEFQKVLKEHGDDTEIRSQFSALLITAGRTSEAEKILAGTLAKNPKDTTALLQRVVARVDAGRLDEASQDVRTLQELKAASALLSYQQARIFAARGEMLRQGDLLVETLKIDPHYLRARLDLATILLTSGKTKNATEVLDQASPPEKLSVEFTYLQNMALMAEGRWPEARKAVDAALAKMRSPGFLYQDAVVRMQNHDLAGARKSVESAFALAPSDAGTINLLGGLMAQQGDQKKLLGLLRDAAARNPGSGVLQNALGAQLAANGDLVGARAAFEAARAAGDIVNADLEIAYLDLHTGGIDKARERVNNLVKSHDTARGRMLLADIEARKGAQPEILVQHYLRALQLESSNAVAMNNLADVLASRQNKLDDAAFWAQKALSLAPGNPAFEDTLGWVLYRQAKYDAALPHLDRSLRTLDRATAHYHLAAVLARLGDLPRARREYQAGLKQEPQSPEKAVPAALLEGR